MIEDDIYRASSQFRLWSYTETSLRSLRTATNQIASDRVRAALRRARERHLSSAAAAHGASQPDSVKEEKDIECLTPEEELVLVRYYCEKTVELGDTYRPPLPTNVRVSFQARACQMLENLPRRRRVAKILTAFWTRRPLLFNTSAASTSQIPL